MSWVMEALVALTNCEKKEEEDIKAGYRCPQWVALGAFSRDATVGYGDLTQL